MGPELTQPPEDYVARKGTLAAEYVLALSVLRRAELSRRRWRTAALVGWVGVVVFVLLVSVGWFG
jgi:hypothetical protein